MSDLYPTPTRIGLLQDVFAGNVIHSITDDEPTVYLVDLTGQPVKVTARVREMERAGWVHLPDPPVYWRLTDEGRAVLDKAGA